MNIRRLLKLLSLWVASLNPGGLFAGPENWKELLLHFSNMNSGSHSEAELKQSGQWLAEQFRSRGFPARWNFEQRNLQTELCPDPSQPIVLFTGHLDTVFESFHPFQKAQVLEENHPFRPVISGPGVVDAKSGILLILHLLETLRAQKWAESLCIKVFIQADEEISSRFSKESLLNYAAGAKLALNFEPAWFEAPQARFITQVGGQGFWSIKATLPSSHLASSSTQGEGAADRLLTLVRRITREARKRKIAANIFALNATSKSNVTTSEASARVSFRYFLESDRVWLKQRIEELSRDQKTFESSFEDRWIPHSLFNEDLLKLANQAALHTKHPHFLKATTLTRSASSFLAELKIPTVEGTGLFGRNYHSENEAVFWGSWEIREAWILEFLKLWQSKN